MWTLADRILTSRLLLGTAGYPSLETLVQSIRKSQTEIITVSIQRAALDSQKPSYFWQSIKSMNCQLLPNTAGSFDLKTAVRTAELSRELFNTHWIKLEVIGDEETLQPNPFELLKAAEILIKRGFEVFPYCTDDLVLCQRLVDIGCRILMPWAAPIGSGKGLLNPFALQILRQRFPDITLIIDAGIGKPSHATQIMELGFDGILLNSAISRAIDPVKMADAFRMACIAGKLGYDSGLMPERISAESATPLFDTLFWHEYHGKA